MTQQSVLNLLKRKKTWMTSKQMAAILKISPGSVALVTKKLFNQGEVLRKTEKKTKGLFELIGYPPYLWRIK